MRVTNLAIREFSGRGDLVSRVRAGDRQAEIELVEQYNRGVMFIIRQELGDGMVADDLYQDTFRIVIEKIRKGDLREPEKLSGFVWGVVRNLIIGHFRQAARHERLTEAEWTDLFPHPAPDQLEALLRKEAGDLVRQVLSRMRHKRDIQVLFRFYLLEDQKELICADLGLSDLEFNLVLYRARERYKKLYQRAMRRKL